nr:MAPK-interacting and spindle-stabilizing protein-like isoform X1 [Zootoca vivipara]
MAPKKPAESGKRKRELILLEVKQGIIRKHEQGMRVVDLAREYRKSASTIATILKDKERIKGRETAKGVTILTKKRPAIMDEVEKLLLLWIREKERAGDTVTSTLVCAKARALHADLIAQQPGTSHEEFKASRGWFEKFKMRSGIRSVVRHGEAASSDLAAAEEFATEFLETVTAEGYLPEQVSNCDETGLFRKRMPRRTFITQEETKMPEEHTPEKQEEKPRQLPLSSYKRACKLWGKLQTFVNDLSEDQAAAQEAVEHFDNVVVAPWRAMLRKRQRQQTLDRFVVKQARQEEEPCCSSQLSPSASSSQK